VPGNGLRHIRGGDFYARTTIVKLVAVKKGQTLSKKKLRTKAKEVEAEQPQEVQVSVHKNGYFGYIFLMVISFICGGLVMVIELTSTRLLAPLYGNTIYCWTGVIGTILFALAVGYLVGGIMADKYQQRKLLPILLLLSAFSVAVIPILGKVFLGSALANQTIIMGPIVGTLAVFLLPAIFLSTIPPACVKGISECLKVVGLASGLVSSISAVGSIIGTFLTGFYLIPTFHLSTIYFISAGILFVLGLLVITKPYWHKLFLVLILVLPLLYLENVRLNAVSIFPDKGEVYRQLSPYHLIRVYDMVDKENNSYYLLQLDSTQEAAMSKKDYKLIFEYTKYWELVQCFLHEEDIHKVCFIGGGGFTMPTVFHKKIPKAHVDVIEIDPALVSVSKTFFKLEESQNFQAHIEDGRRWFRDKKDCYDFIFLDAFRGPRNVPPHLITKEFFGELSNALTAKGVLGINIISARDGKFSVFYQSLIKTLSAKFDKLFVFAPYSVAETDSSNIILFCVKDAHSVSSDTLLQKSIKYNLKHLSQNLVRILEKEDMEKYRDSIELTDEYAPVETMSVED
jgi:spermidine synthase